jgi:hypothetical protein
VHTADGLRIASLSRPQVRPTIVDYDEQLSDRQEVEARRREKKKDTKHGGPGDALSLKIRRLLQIRTAIGMLPLCPYRERSQNQAC